MKKLLVSLLAVSLIPSLSVNALEKPGTEDVDIETYRIEEMLQENPGEHIYHSKKLAQLDKQTLSNKIKELKEKAKKVTGAAVANIKAKIKQYKADLAKIK
jgi:predicted transcriptional regulator